MSRTKQKTQCKAQYTEKEEYGTSSKTTTQPNKDCRNEHLDSGKESQQSTLLMEAAKHWEVRRKIGL